jgi:uncharacterized Tic20 family protein
MHPLSERDERLYGALSHLASLVGFVIPLLGGVGGPLLVWLLQRDRSAFVDRHGKEAINFQISLLIYATIAGFLHNGAVLFVLPIAGVVLCVLAAVAANEGKSYRYPLTIRFLQ